MSVSQVPGETGGESVPAQGFLLQAIELIVFPGVVAVIGSAGPVFGEIRAMARRAQGIGESQEGRRRRADQRGIHLFQPVLLSVGVGRFHTIGRSRVWIGHRFEAARSPVSVPRVGGSIVAGAGRAGTDALIPDKIQPPQGVIEKP